MLVELMMFTATLFVLAFIPSASSLLVISRSINYGLVQGAAVGVGIACGDIVFVLIAIYGMTTLMDLMSDYFIWVKYLAAAYLLILGLMLLLKKSARSNYALEQDADASLLSGYVAGLLLTLADHKAILFYLGLLPTVLDLQAMTSVMTGLIVLLTGIAVATPKIIYAVVAARASKTLGLSSASNMASRIAGFILIVVAGNLLLREFNLVQI